MIKTDISLQELRDKIGTRAKSAPRHRFWGLFVHIKKMDVLRTSYLEARRKRGAPGLDGVNFDQIDEGGREAFLAEIQQSLETQSYRPGRYRKIEIPKSNGKTRTISIPNIRDRVVQGALKLILEPIFEADFADTSYGARPGRSAHQAIEQIRKGLAYKKHYVVDVDLKGYFDNILHAKILSRVARRVQDPVVLAAVKAFLKSAGRRGIPQGSPLSPLIANLMLTDLDNALHDERGFLFYVRYLDDMLVLAPVCNKGRFLAQRALKRIQAEAEAIGVSLNLEKTHEVCITDKGTSFAFLGCVFRWKKSRVSGRWFAFVEPQKSKVVSLYQNLRLRLRRAGHLTVTDAVKLLNPVIRGWVNYFRGGNSGRVFTKVRHFVELLVRRFAARQRGRRGRGWNRWSSDTVYGVWGLYKDYQIVYNYGLVKVASPARRIITSS